MSDYWEECISEAFDDAKITATDTQRDLVASWVEGAFDNYGMAHGHDCIPNPLRAEIDRVKRDLKQEQDKVRCEDCNGTGRYVSCCGHNHLSHSDCFKCNGEGRHTR